jgi:cysteine sulfinate desulfinase/cysteine desulfurase-like protein
MAISMDRKRALSSIRISFSAMTTFQEIKEFEEMEELPKIKSENLYELSWQKQEEKLIKLYQKLIAEK